MAASVFELILARVAAVLLAGSTAAGSNIFRARDDAFGDNELPAINVRRADSGGDVITSSGERHVLAFTLTCMAAGDDWETAVDALHMQAHALLLADAVIAAKGKGLRLLSTDLQNDSADQVRGRLTARYQIQILVRPGDFSVAT